MIVIVGISSVCADVLIVVITGVRVEKVDIVFADVRAVVGGVRVVLIYLRGRSCSPLLSRTRSYRRS